METSRTVALTQSVPVAVLGANSARKGYRIQNLASSDASNAVLVRAYTSPVLATVAAVRHVLFDATPTAGSFKIRFTNPHTGVALTSGAIAAGASNATVQTAVRLLAGYGSVTVGNPDAGIGYKLTLTSAPVPDAKLTVVESSLTVAGTAEVQTMTIPNNPGSDTPASGAFRLLQRSLAGSLTQVVKTPDIAYDASAATIQAAVRAAFNDNDLVVAGANWAAGFSLTFGVKEPKQLLEVYASTMRNAGDDETQTVTFSDTPEVGSFKLGYQGVKSTAIAFGADAAAVQVALRTIPTLIGVTVTGDFATGFIVTFAGAGLDGGNPSLLEATDVSLEAAEDSENQLIEFSAIPDEGQFKLKYGETKTELLDFESSAVAIENELQAIAGLAEVTVAGDFEGGFTITFDGVVGDIDLLEVTDTTLKASDEDVSATVSEDSPGTSIDVTVTPSETLAGGTKKITPTIARTTPGVAAVTVAASVVETTAGDLKALVTSVAGASTLDQSDSGTKTAVYAATEATGVSVIVTEVF